jgi:hypothetical protein
MSDTCGSSGADSRLSPEARADWLRNYGMPESTPDDEILLAIGSGLA